MKKKKISRDQRTIALLREELAQTVSYRDHIAAKLQESEGRYKELDLRWKEWRGQLEGRRDLLSDENQWLRSLVTGALLDIHPPVQTPTSLDEHCMVPACKCRDLQR